MDSVGTTAQATSMPSRKRPARKPVANKTSHKAVAKSPVTKKIVTKKMKTAIKKIATGRKVKVSSSFATGAQRANTRRALVSLKSKLSIALVQVTNALKNF